MINLLYALLVLPVNAVFVWVGIAHLQELEVSDFAVQPLWWTVGGYGFTGLMLVVGGIGLCARQRWGIWLSLVAAGLLFATVFVAMAGVNVTYERARMEYRGLPTQIELRAGLPALWPGYGAVLVALLTAPSVRGWARAERDRRHEIVELEPSRRVSLSVLAVLTFVFSLTPAAGLTQAAALILGVFALGRIARSRGRLTGVGLAVAGMTFSVLTITGYVVWDVLVGNMVGTLWQSMPLCAVCGLVALVLSPFLTAWRRSGDG